MEDHRSQDECQDIYDQLCEQHGGRGLGYYEVSAHEDAEGLQSAFMKLSRKIASRINFVD